MNSPDPGKRWLVVLVVLALGATVAATLGWQRARELRTEVGRQQEAVRRLEEARRRDQPRLDQLEAAEAEVARLRRQTEEVHRLRGQYREWQRLQSNYARLEQENQQLRGGAQSAGRAKPGSPAPVPSSWIGVTLREQPAGQVVIDSVVPGSPAAQAGLTSGDLIAAVDSRAMGGPQQFRDEVGNRQPGQAIALDVVRGTNAFHLVLTTGVFPR